MSHTLTPADFVVRLAIGAGLGVLIGFERQWRQRTAGLHTSGLVATGATLFALLDTVINGNDVSRILAGIVTGVGFISGGVILRDGANVVGLNTAATIWATAAVGALAGVGFFEQAAVAAVAILLLNVLMQPLAERIDYRSRHRKNRETIYKLQIACTAAQQSAVRHAIVTAVSESPLSLRSLINRNAAAANVEINADLYSPVRNDPLIEVLASELSAMPGVSASDWHAVDV
ncbi:MAG TPA: MgtC/SapB family protein [Candidatus Tumulicola sp.]|nr:MgtC/SapB family protein [Candidatus Tumulicola sp.]